MEWEWYMFIIWIVVSKLCKLYPINTRNVLYVNYTSAKLLYTFKNRRTLLTATVLESAALEVWPPFRTPRSSSSYRFSHLLSKQDFARSPSLFSLLPEMPSYTTQLPKILLPACHSDRHNLQRFLLFIDSYTTESIRAIKILNNIVISSFYRQGNWGAERLRLNLNVTQKINGKRILGVQVSGLFLPFFFF